MARSIVFASDPESCTPLAGSHLLGRNVVPFSVRLREFNKEKKLNPRMEWGHFIGFFEEETHRDDECDDEWNFRHLRRMRKPLFSWLLAFIEKTEERLGLSRDFQDAGQLAWTFNFYMSRSESEEAIRFSTPTWFVTVTDPEGNIVHPNWTVMLDYEGDFSIKRGVATNDDPMSRNSLIFWHNAEGRLIDAMRSHMRLRELKIKRMKQVL